MGKTDKPKDSEAEKVAPPEASEANEAARTEADPPAEVTVEHDGITYPLVVSTDGWPMEATLALAEMLDIDEGSPTGLLVLPKHIAAFLKAVLGPSGWARFRASNPSTKSMRELQAKTMRVLMGGEPGE